MHNGRPYKRYAHRRYRLFSGGLSALSHVKPLFTLALRVLTHSKRRVKAHILPVNVPLGEPTQAALGREVLSELIARSTAVAAMRECMCRAVGGCEDYPQDLGCLVLGSEALRVHPALGRAVGRDEALAIVDRALALGLTPMVIHFKGDSVLWSLDHRRMLTVCFCCPCHCLIRESIGNRAPASRGITGLPGAAVSLDRGKCVGCGRCAEACSTGAIAVVDGKAQIDREKCVVCARCAMACRRGAPVVEAVDECGAEPLISEFESRTEGDSVFKTR